MEYLSDRDNAGIVIACDRINGDKKRCCFDRYSGYSFFSANPGE